MAICTFWGGASRFSRCLSLRGFMIFWLTIVVVVGAVELIVGSYLSSAKFMVQGLLDMIRRYIDTLDDPTQAQSYFGVIEDTLNQVWSAGSLLTTVRGLIDLISAGICIFAMWKRNKTLIYVFLGVNIFNFLLDVLLLVTFCALFEAYYVTYFFKIATLIPVLLFGWEIVAAPFVIHYILSYAYVMAVGGTGTEMKDWKTIEAEKNAIKEESSTLLEKSVTVDVEDEGESKADTAEAGEEPVAAN